MKALGRQEQAIVLTRMNVLLGYHPVLIALTLLEGMPTCVSILSTMLRNFMSSNPEHDTIVYQFFFKFIPVLGIIIEYFY